MRMIDRSNEDNNLDELTEERFNDTYNIFAKRTGNKYNFIMKGGQSLKAALFNLCKVVWRTEKQPQR